MTEQTTPGDAILTAEDINNAASLIDLAQQRGAFKITEAEIAGYTYKKFSAILKVMQERPEATEAVVEDAEAVEKTEAEEEKKPAKKPAKGK